MKSFIQCCFISGCPDKEVKVISTPMSYNVPLENSCIICINNKSYAKTPYVCEHFNTINTMFLTCNSITEAGINF